MISDSEKAAIERIYLDELTDRGFSRSEAFTLVRDRHGATYGVTSIAYPSPESSPVTVPDEEHTYYALRYDEMTRVITALRHELKPYLSDEDVERVVMKAIEG